MVLKIITKATHSDKNASTSLPTEEHTNSKPRHPTANAKRKGNKLKLKHCPQLSTG